MDEEKIYCKKCGAWVVPENGECPRCGYVFEKKGKWIILALVAAGVLLILLSLLL